MKFEFNVAKYADHEVYSKVFPKFPTLRLFEDNMYALAIGLHKWKDESDNPKTKGEFLAIYKICDFHSSWDSVDLSETYHLLQTQKETLINFDTQSLEDGTYDDSNVLIYKFSVNVWRKVEYIGKKVKKWTYIDVKPEKDSHSKVQRLLLE